MARLVCAAQMQQALLTLWQCHIEEQVRALLRCLLTLHHMLRPADSRTATSGQHGPELDACHAVPAAQLQPACCHAQMQA